MISHLLGNLKLYKSFLIYFIGILFIGFINFLLVPFVVNVFGVKIYGEYSLFQNVVLILISFSSGWICQCVLRFNNRSTRFRLLLYELFFNFVLPFSLIGGIIIYGFVSDIFLAVIGCLSIFFGGFWTVLLAFKQSELKSIQYMIWELTRVFLYFISIVFLSYFSGIKDVYLLAISLLSSQSLSFFFLLTKQGGIFIKRFSRNAQISPFYNNKEYKLYFNYGWPLALWFSISSVLNVADRYFIKFFFTDHEVGVYSSVYDLIYKGITICFTPILAVGFPVVVKKFNDFGKPAAIKFVFQLFALEILIFVFVFIISNIYGSAILVYILKIPEKDINELLMPILFGAFFWQLAMLGHKLLELELKTKLMLYFVILALIVNLVLNYIFMPMIGVYFAGYSTIISAVFYLVVCLGYTLFTLYKS